MIRVHDESLYVSKYYEVKTVDFLGRLKNDILNVKQATRFFTNLIVEKNLVSRVKPLTIVFLFINLITFNRIGPSAMYKIFYRIRFSKRVNIILNDFKMNKIGFEKAKLRLKEVVESRLI